MHIPNIAWPSESEDTISCCRRELFEGSLFYYGANILEYEDILLVLQPLPASCVKWIVTATWLRCGALPNAVAEQLIGKKCLLPLETFLEAIAERRGTA